MKTMWMLPAVIVGVMICSILSGTDVYGAEKEQAKEEFFYVDEWLASSELNAINQGLEKLFPDTGMNTGELLSMIMRGEFAKALKMLMGEIKDQLAGELGGLKQVFIYILVLGVFSALFAGFSDLFSGQQIAHAGFYFLYLLLMGILTKVFLFVSEIAVNTVETIVLFVKLFIPTYFTAVGLAHGGSFAVYYYQIMLLIAYLVENCLVKVLIPFIYSYVMLALLNGLWAEEKLALLLEFIEKGITFALKVSMGAVTGLSLVQAVILPVTSCLKISAMRKAVSAIPGLGGVTEGVTELILGSAVLIKNSMGILLLILILGACTLPVLKILIVTGTVKLGAAVAGIVSDKRIAACADRVGIGCFLLLRCVFTGVALFVIVIAVVSYTVSS